jgi:RNA polymerase sigma-70 factor (ECF subfamily)
MHLPENGGKKFEDNEAHVLGRVHATARELAGRLVRGRARADDIAQEVVLDYLRRLRSGRGVQPERLDAYVATIVLRRRSDMRLRRRRGAARDWTYLCEITASRRAWMDPEVNMRERELEALYRRTLDSLPLRCRQAFLAVREQELSYAEAARSLGVSVKMIAKYITQAQRVFRGALRKQGIRVPREKGGETPVAFVPRVTESVPANVRAGAVAQDERAVQLAKKERENRAAFEAQLGAFRRTAAVFQRELASRQRVEPCPRRRQRTIPGFSRDETHETADRAFGANRVPLPRS